MKRNRENKSRVRLFATFHLQKSAQQRLDNLIKVGSLNYADLWHDIRSKGLHKTIFDLIDEIVADYLKKDDGWYGYVCQNTYSEFIKELHSMEYVMHYSLVLNKKTNKITKINTGGCLGEKKAFVIHYDGDSNIRVGRM